MKLNPQGGTMADNWSKQLACSTHCSRCRREMRSADPRILSVYDHRAICMPCKREEEKRPDYEAVSKQAIGQCLIDTELSYGDPAGFCYHHFYPFTC
jgi:hypothetical protein